MTDSEPFLQEIVAAPMTTHHGWSTPIGWKNRATCAASSFACNVS
jgi:hypothetical protein